MQGLTWVSREWGRALRYWAGTGALAGWLGPCRAGAQRSQQARAVRSSCLAWTLGGLLLWSYHGTLL